MRTIVCVVAALGHHYCRNGVLEDELFLIVGFQDDRVLVERPYTACEFDPAQEVNRDLRLLLARGVEKRVLYVLRRLVFHLPIFLL